MHSAWSLVNGNECQTDSNEELLRQRNEAEKSRDQGESSALLFHVLNVSVQIWTPAAFTCPVCISAAEHVSGSVCPDLNPAAFTCPVCISAAEHVSGSVCPDLNPCSLHLSRLY